MEIENCNAEIVWGLLYQVKNSIDMLQEIKQKNIFQFPMFKAISEYKSCNGFRDVLSECVSVVC